MRFSSGAGTTLLNVNANEWMRQGYPHHRRCCRSILPFPSCHCCRLRHCFRRRRCDCDILGRLLRYGLFICPPPFSATSVCTLPAVPMVVPLPPLSVGVAADVTAATIGATAEPSAFNLAYPAVFRYFLRVGQYLSSSSFSSFYLSSSMSSSSSYSSPSTAAFLLSIVVPAEAEPVGEG